MPRQQLKEALDALHRELEAGGELRQDERAALEEAVREIEDALAEAKPGQSGDSLNERVAAMVRDFESSHPKFAEILNNVSDALANMGI